MAMGHLHNAEPAATITVSRVFSLLCDISHSAHRLPLIGGRTLQHRRASLLRSVCPIHSIGIVAIVRKTASETSSSLIQGKGYSDPTKQKSRPSSIRKSFSLSSRARCKIRFRMDRAANRETPRYRRPERRSERQDKFVSPAGDTFGGLSTDTLEQSRLELALQFALAPSLAEWQAGDRIRALPGACSVPRMMR